MKFIKYIFTPNHEKYEGVRPMLLRLGSVSDAVYLRTVAAVKMAADRDLHDLL